MKRTSRRARTVAAEARGQGGKRVSGRTMEARTFRTLWRRGPVSLQCFSWVAASAPVEVNVGGEAERLVVVLARLSDASWVNLRPLEAAPCPSSFHNRASRRAVKETRTHAAVDARLNGVDARHARAQAPDDVAVAVLPAWRPLRHVRRECRGRTGDALLHALVGALGEDVLGARQRVAPVRLDRHGHRPACARRRR